MAETTIFYIADFQIDLSRSVVCKGDAETQVEPKVLKVLLLLAQRQNEVVTHKEIMEQVWQGTEVVPNALQRCIAILRKELGDDAKSPTIIATHPKIGYRLLAEVRWHQEPDIQLSESQSPHSARLLLALSAFFLATLVAVFWPYTSLENHLQSDSDVLHHQYTDIKPLTYTDAHESHVIFSPDAMYLVFNRYAGSCKNHLWARHLASGQEQQLTAQAGDFGAVSFTGDGRELVFAARNQCNESNLESLEDSLQPESETLTCWSLATLDFAQALNSPQTPQFRYQCRADRVTTPKALANHQYVYLEASEGNNKLMHYNDLNNTLRPFYAPDKQYIYHFDYHWKQQRFAVFSHDNDFNHLLTLLDESGKFIGSKVIELLPGMSRISQFFGNFESAGEYLLAVSNNQLYKIALNGEVSLVKTPGHNLVSVVKHPTESLLGAVQGRKDIDIAQVILGSDSPAQNFPEPDESDLNGIRLPFPAIARTSAQERLARFQPGGDTIAFISDRSGKDQLWVWHKGEASQLSFNGQHEKIHGYSWSPTGTHLAWANGNSLVISDVNGNTDIVATDKPIHSVLSWYRDNQLLVLLNDPQPGGLYHLDLVKGEVAPFGINQVESAWPVQNKIIFTTTRGEVFIRSLEISKNETKPLANLNSRALFVANDNLYSVAKNSLELKQYDLQGQLLNSVIHLKPTAWKATDLSGDKLLVSQFIAIDQDIVLLESN